MSLKPIIAKNAQRAIASSGQISSAIRKVSIGDSNSISKLNKEAKDLFGFSRIATDADAGLEFVMSNSSLSKTRRDDLYVDKDSNENNLDTSRADKSQSGQTAMNDYVDQGEKNIDQLAERKKATNKQENI